MQNRLRFLENLNALDSDSIGILKDILRAVQDKGTTIISTSHNSSDITELSTDVQQISAT